MAWAPPRNLTKWPDWEEARKLENDEWRLEPEGEAEVPEIIIVSDAVEGTNVDLDGESRHEQSEANFSRRDGEVPGEEGEELTSPKRNVIRVETEETQDYVREAKSAEQEEVEERIFVPSAVGVPKKVMFRCDRQCSEKSLSYWQLASVVIMMVRNRTRPRRKTTDKCAVETGCGEEGVPWKDVENDGKKAEDERQAGIQGRWQLVSPAREYLEQVKCCHDTDCTHRMMKKGGLALKSEE